jgi:DNA replication licensing factor MCM7
MALVQYPPPVDYAAQLNAFKDFLQHFKTFESASEAAATEAIEDLHIDGDATSDEYDFMDDVENENGQQGTRACRGRREPKLKYMQILQDIADRERSNVLIELDDLATVRLQDVQTARQYLILCPSSRNPCRRTQI